MNQIEIQKQELRNVFKSERSKLSLADVKNKSKKICENFIKNLLPKLLEEKPNAIFSLYLAANNEASCEDIIKYFRNKKISFCYPKIIEKNSPLKFVLDQENQNFVTNKFFPKISESTSQNLAIPDFIIIPLLAFDKKKNRLGMGGGFFDRTLNDFKQKNHKITTIGLGYDFQLYNKDLPTINTDESLDFIASESGIFF